jgi:hypothetical protein
MEDCYQTFSRAHCHEETTGFIFLDEKDRKFCSSLHRRQFLEAEKKARQQAEDDYQDAISESAG